MAPFEKKDGEGSLFHNEQTTERHPAHKGYVLAHRDIRKGEEVALALWNGKEGSRQSFKVKMEDKREPKPQSISEQAQAKIRKPDPISSRLPPKRSILPDDDMEGDGIPF